MTNKQHFTILKDNKPFKKHWCNIPKDDLLHKSNLDYIKYLTKWYNLNSFYKGNFTYKLT